jgi:hypothetical protein
MAGKLVEAARPCRFAAAAELSRPCRVDAGEVGVVPDVRVVSAAGSRGPGHFVVHADSPEGAAQRVTSLSALVAGEAS